MFFWKREKANVKRLIVGLGNPEHVYKGTRHNIGFEAINKLSFDYNISVNKNRHKGLVGTGNLAGFPVLLLKPQTYMNLSGTSVIAALDYYKLGAEDLIVVYDEVSLPLGDIRVRERGSAGGHNGMKNIIAKLGTDSFIRIRIGIDAMPPGYKLADYVLSRFTEKDREGMIEGVTKAGDAVIKILSDGPVAAMNQYNKKQKSGGTDI